MALTRKNALFAGADTGAETLARAMTIIETTKMNGLNPQADLTDILTRIHDHKINRLDELLDLELVVPSRRLPRGCLMAAITHVCTLDYVAAMLGEDLKLLEAIVANDENLTYGAIISVYTGPDEAITALTDDDIHELKTMITDARRSPESWNASSLTISSRMQSSPPAPRPNHSGNNRAVTLDITFGEDQSRLRKGHGARNVATVRHFAINLVRSTADRHSIKSHCKIAG